VATGQAEGSGQAGGAVAAGGMPAWARAACASALGGTTA
jgi:hypothetical protein